MKIISSFLEKYLNRKLKFEIINFIIRAFICLVWLLLILILIEKDAFLKPNIKIKIFDVTYAIIIFIITYLSLKVIIHKNHLFNNSNKKDLAKELIDKIPTKDRIINVLQIYSVLNLNNPYSDLTTKAVNDLEEKINFSDLKKINLKLSPYIVYITIFTIMIPFSLINFSNSYYEASIRLFSKNILFEKPLPFNLKVKPNNSISFKGEDYNLDIIGQGKLPNQIKLFWSNGNNVYNRKLNKNDDTYTYILKNINTETRIWAEYQNDAIMPYNQYTIYSDTVNIRLQTRPKIEDLNITIIPPDYTKINSYQHENTAIKINALKGSKLKFKGTANKKITSANLLFNKDSIINMNINNTNISSDFKIIESNNIAIICYDEENNNSIKIKYSINAINDMKPTIIIDKPLNKIKLDENYLIEILGKISDDFGIEEVLLQYRTIKPYYLDQDTTLNEILIFNKIKENIKDEYLNYSWDISNLNIGPGDEIEFWIKAYDNNNITGPGIGISNKLKAYFPSLEELFLELEDEQENIYEDFNDMNQSMEELKNMYNNISNDILKEDIGWEQEQSSEEMMNELENISTKIESLEQTIEAIEQLNENNNLINENLGDKIAALQKMFQDMMTPELIKALQELQNSLNENDLKKSLEQLNDFEFEISDLEKKIDRMMDLFEKIIAEQKLDELIKKVENMAVLQNDISNQLNENNANTKSMENQQRDNLDNLLKTIKEAESLIKDENIIDDLKKLRNSSTMKTLQNEISNISSENAINTKKTISNKIEQYINETENKLNEIISKHNKKTKLEILTMYTRIIKNLLDMSYEQEIINKNSENIKYRTDKEEIKNIASQENTILYQYKNIFIQISELSSKSFHLKPETSKTFGQIFNNIIKAINNFEQGQIKDAKDNQKFILENINKAIVLLLHAMDEMQASNSPSGYSEYLQSLEQLMGGQQSVNEGMQSLLPMPFGQQPGENGLMQSLMKQQQQLMQQLKELIEQGNNGGAGSGNGELGKAMQDMEEIMKDLRNNTINEETFERGKKAYNKLLNHQKSTREKDKGKLWKTENFNNEELIGNDKTKNLKGNKNLEIKDLYKTLNELNQNQDITKENKNIIEEYIKILIDEKMENNNEK